MTDLDIIDAEIVVTATDLDASMSRVEASVSSIADELVWQLTSEAWRADGRYSSFSDLWADRWEPLGISVPRTVRPLAIEQMRREHLTQQQIADKLNVSQFTVSRDLRAANIDTNNGLPATITNSRGEERPATYRKPATTLRDAGVVDMATGEIYDPATVTPENREAIQAERGRMLGMFTDASMLSEALNRLASLSDPRRVTHYLEVARAARDRPDFNMKHHNPESIRNIAQHLLDYANALEEQS